ncbi:MAG: c-type cytochrome [Acidobacteria bacterium]|nr:c-type cytochrome [Acidobacteriota bacterium]
MILTRCAPLALVLALVPAAQAAHAGQAAVDVGEGKKLFQGMCGRCHGIDGTGDEGPNLARPTLTRATDDESLRAIIRDGIADRGMPRVRRMTDTELDQLVAYVRSLGRSPTATSTGNAQRGGEIYTRLGCASCHIVQGQGGSFGPDLTEIGASRGPSYLRQSFLGPAEMLPQGSSPVPGRGFSEYLPVHVVTSDGREVRGIRINEDPFTIQLRDTNNRFHSFRKSDLKQFDKEFGKSLMPSFRGRLSDAENEDLVAYLASLRGAK